VLIPEVSYDPAKLARLVMWDQRVTPSNYAIITVCDGSRIEEDKVLEYTPYLSPRSKSVVLRQMTIEKAKAIHAERGFTLEEVVETGSSLSGSGLVAVELLRHLTSQEVIWPGGATAWRPKPRWSCNRRSGSGAR
jgi:hypothetical protein